MSANRHEPIAVVSMGCVFPNAFDISHYWQTLVKGTTSFKPTTTDLWNSEYYFSQDRRSPDKYYDDIVSYPDGFSLDYSKFQSSESYLKNLHRRDQYVYKALHEVFADLNISNSSVKIFVGHTSMADSINGTLFVQQLMKDWSQSFQSDETRKIVLEKLNKLLENHSDSGDLSSELMHLKIAHAVQHIKNEVYPIQLVDAACASSIYTVQLGILDLLKGEVEVAICGGVSFSDPLGKVLFCRLGGSSAHGVFPFQSRADGTVFGEGAGFIALKKIKQGS